MLLLHILKVLQYKNRLLNQEYLVIFTFSNQNILPCPTINVDQFVRKGQVTCKGVILDIKKKYCYPFFELHFVRHCRIKCLTINIFAHDENMLFGLPTEI